MEYIFSEISNSFFNLDHIKRLAVAKKNDKIFAIAVDVDNEEFNLKEFENRKDAIAFLEDQIFPED